MRKALLTLALLLSTLALPQTAAEAALTDKKGDVAATGGPAPLPDNPQTASADLVALEATEGDNDWAFTLQVASLAQPGGTLNRYFIDFTWDDASYRVSILRSRVDPTATPLLRAQLLRANGEEYEQLAALAPTADDAQGKISVSVGKVYVVSLEGHSPVPGSQLTDLVASARGDVTFGGQGTRLEDRMPDTGAGALTYTKGGESNGHLVLESQDPVRISNGGATTFVYKAHLQNALETDDEVALRIEGLPEGWSATVESPQRVPAKEEAPVFAIASIPFAHEHGGFSNFTLVAESTSKPGIRATIRFGVLHTPIPQPAGHHAELYLHAEPSDTGLFGTAFPGTTNTMNTMSDHAADAEYASADRQGGLSWSIPLGPQLAMGLDFDLNKTGELAGSIMGRMTGGATLTGEVILVRGAQDAAKLADLAPATLTLDLQTPTAFTSVVTPTPEAEYIPYEPGQNFVLRLEVKPDSPAPCCNPQQPPALVVKDFRLALPLNEYHDTPTFEVGEESSITLAPEAATEKIGRPGTTVAYPWTATNRGQASATFEVAIAGTDASKATFAPEGDVTLGPGESRRIVLAVQVPPGAQSEEILEAILVVRQKDDPSNLALGRTTTTVGVTGAVDDERQVLEDARSQGNDAPGLGLVAMLVAILGIALARQRRGGWL